VNRKARGVLRPVLLICFTVSALFGQDYSQRGFLETRFTLYPREAPNDRAHSVVEGLFRYEGFYKAAGSLQINGAVDVRLDSHHQGDRQLDFSWWDRQQKRPLVAVRRLSGHYHTGGLSIEVGKQFIRWGKADIINPTDRFAPRDFLTVIDNDFLGITAARVTYERGSETIDAVWSPNITTSRIPLPDQRWVVVPGTLPNNVVFRDGGALYPASGHGGLRWNHVGVLEFSASYYQGFNHLPSFESALSFNGNNVVVDLQSFYPRMKMAGMDAAIPLRWFGIKAEAGYFASSDPRADDYGQYVLQLERHVGEWTFVGGYAGEWVATDGTLTVDFAPDRGFSKTMLGSARYVIDTNRSISVETAIRQNADGGWVRAEYSQIFGQHWRATANFSIIRGEPTDFLGQYHRNSHGVLILRYSF